MQFKKAEKSTSLLRCAIHGPTGSGKTLTALRIATGMNKRLNGHIALIDTERARAQKYADRFDFDTLDLPKNDIDTYIAAMDIAAKKRYDVLIIDSLSHAWKELLEEVDKIASAKYRGNTFSAWSEGTPKQQRFVEEILSYPGHVIVTMRSKMEYSLEKTENGKIRPVKVGLQPQQGKDIEYEFDILIEMNMEHMGFISKDITDKFQDDIYKKPGEEFGLTLIDWLNEGKKIHPNQKFIDSVIGLGVDSKIMNAIIKELGHKSLETILDRETQKTVYKKLHDSLKQKSEPSGAEIPWNVHTPVMDKKTKDFLSAMEKVKAGLNEKTGNDGIYYNTLGANGYEHANQIHDENTMKTVYKELYDILKYMTGGSNA